MSLDAIVKGNYGADSQWKEVAPLITFSATGSSFCLPRQCEVGTLVSMMVDLPVHLRSYDFEKDFYRVWGLVQHCQRITADDGTTSFHVGVAFIGKRSPESYKENPMQHYRISGVNDNGMWKVEDAKTPFRRRSEVRFWTQVNLYLALVDPVDGSPGGERTTAENVSRGGAAVFTTMNVNVGDRVKFISEEFDFSGLAVVCNRQDTSDGKTKLHIKFVQSTFPVKTLMKSNVAVQRI